MADTISIAAIKHPAGFRRDLGSISELESDLKLNGLKHPIIIDGDDDLISGARRLKAMSILGWQLTDVIIVKTTEQAAQAIKREGRGLKMNPSEWAAQGLAIENLGGRETLTERQKIVAKAVAEGYSTANYLRVRRVLRLASESGKAQKQAREALEVMDITGRPGKHAERIATLVEGHRPRKDKKAGKYSKWDKTTLRWQNEVTAHVRRFWTSLHLLDTATNTLVDVEPEPLAAGLSPDEVDSIRKMIKSLYRRLRYLERRLPQKEQ